MTKKQTDPKTRDGEFINEQMQKELDMDDVPIDTLV